MTAQIKKTDKAKMSHTGKAPPKPQLKSKLKSKGRRFLRGTLWLLLALLVLVGIAIAYGWFNRTNLMESQIRKLMAEQGYDVALDITGLSKTRAVATDIVISKEGAVFFKAERAIVDYDIGKRMAQRIELVRPYIKVTLDSKGNITSSWTRPKPGGKSDNSQKLLLPPDGLSIQDGIIDWQMMLDETSPMGAGRTHIDADINTISNWKANISAQHMSFETPLLRGTFEHDIFIETTDGKSFDVSGKAAAKNLGTVAAQSFQLDGLTAEFKINFTRPDGLKRPVKLPALSGWINTKLDGFTASDYKIANADMRISDISSDSKGNIFANWSGAIKGIQFSNIENRKNLADKLTAHSALTHTPIVQYFTPNLYAKVERLLGELAVDGRGTIRTSQGNHTIALAAPLRLKSADQTVVLTQIGDSFIEFNKPEEKLTLRSDIEWTGKQALKLAGFSVTAKSPNGIRIDGLQNMQARVRSAREWRLHSAKGKEREDIRLAPFDIDFAYTDQGRNRRNVRIDGGIDYDGPVPGGAVIGLVADGVMDLHLHGDDFALGYTPSGPLSIADFTNPSGWTTKALKFTMEPETSLLRKTANSRAMRTTLKDVSTQIIGPENKRHLDARFARLDITTDFAKSPQPKSPQPKSPQQWQIEVTGTNITSEDFPAPGTHIISKAAMLNVFQAQNGDMTFDLLSPHTQVATDNVVVENLHISLSGSPDDIALKYAAGSVTMVGGAIPVLPMHGTARLKSGELSGHAITELPRTTDTPIDIHFRSVDGQGSAKILIPKIIFDPRGLQPQHLIPVLRGKLADVSGEVSAEFDFKFGGGLPVRSSGSTELKNLNIGTLVGPVSGIQAQLSLSSIFPLQTDGVQIATLAGFDPGFPLKDGTIKFEIVPDGIKVFEAIWPIENVVGAPGKIYLTPADWRFGDVENRVVVNVENVGLETMLAGIGKDKFSATGQVFGTLPARIKGVDVLIEDGVLAINDGGIIRYKSAATNAAAARNKNAEYAFKALENFHYKQLEARIDGPIDGAMALGIVFDGQNPDVLGGQPFKFNTVIKGELANIARNMAGAFSNEENLARILEIRDGKTEE